MMHFSRRSEVIVEQDAFQTACRRVALSGGPQWDLTRSNPTTAALDEPAALARDLLAPLGASSASVYRPTALGASAARSVLAALWAKRGAAVLPSELFLTSSTSEAYSVLFKLLCDAGDEVLVPQPSYPLFEELARYEQVKLVPYPLRYDGAWSLDASALLAARTQKTRAAIVVSPNNPTGNYARAEEYEALFSLGVPVISDEVFRDYTLTAERQATGALSYYEQNRHDSLLFCLDGLSKYAGLPQYKLAWTVVAGPEAKKRDALERLDYLLDAYLSVGSPVQGAIEELLHLSAPRRHAIQARIRTNYASLRQMVAATTVTCLHSEGGWSAVVRLPNTRSEEQWAIALLEQCSLLVQPGWYYDFNEQPLVVLSLLTPTTEFQAGVAMLLKLTEAD